MARIDIFLDLDDVLQQTLSDPKTGKAEVFPLRNAVRALNSLIDRKLAQGHHVTLVPVTSHRKDMDSKALRAAFEGIGVRSGLALVHMDDGTRDTVVARRYDGSKNDAYVIFDDQPDFYPDKTNVIAVRRNIRDMVTGITPAHMQQAYALIDAQLAALPIRRDPSKQTPSGPQGPDDLA